MVRWMSKGKPLIATAHQLEKVFARNAELDIPEKALFFAVIMQAVRDLAFKEQRRSAIEFLWSRRFAGISESIGLAHEWVRVELQRHAGLPARRARR